MGALTDIGISVVKKITTDRASIGKMPPTQAADVLLEILRPALDQAYSAGVEVQLSTADRRPDDPQGKVAAEPCKTQGYDPAVRYEEIGTSLGKMLRDKDRAYGRAWLRVSDFLKLLFPKGISPEQYVDALLIVRVFDKLSRIATDKDAFNEDAWKDLAGYAILGASRKDDQVPKKSDNPHEFPKPGESQ